MSGPLFQSSSMRRRGGLRARSRLNINSGLQLDLGPSLLEGASPVSAHGSARSAASASSGGSGGHVGASASDVLRRKAAAGAALAAAAASGSPQSSVGGSMGTTSPARRASPGTVPAHGSEAGTYGGLAEMAMDAEDPDLAHVRATSLTSAGSGGSKGVARPVGAAIARLNFDDDSDDDEDDGPVRTPGYGHQPAFPTAGDEAASNVNGHGEGSISGSSATALGRRAQRRAESTPMAIITGYSMSVKGIKNLEKPLVQPHFFRGIGGADPDFDKVAAKPRLGGLSLGFLGTGSKLNLSKGSDMSGSPGTAGSGSPSTPTTPGAVRKLRDAERFMGGGGGARGGGVLGMRRNRGGRGRGGLKLGGALGLGRGSGRGLAMGGGRGGGVAGLGLSPASPITPGAGRGIDMAAMGPGQGFSRRGGPAKRGRRRSATRGRGGLVGIGGLSRRSSNASYEGGVGGGADAGAMAGASAAQFARGTGGGGRGSGGGGGGASAMVADSPETPGETPAMAQSAPFAAHLNLSGSGAGGRMVLGARKAPGAGRGGGGRGGGTVSGATGPARPAALALASPSPAAKGSFDFGTHSAVATKYQPGKEARARTRQKAAAAQQARRLAAAQASQAAGAVTPGADSEHGGMMGTSPVAHTFVTAGGGSTAPQPGADAEGGIGELSPSAKLLFGTPADVVDDPSRTVVVVGQEHLASTAPAALGGDGDAGEGEEGAYDEGGVQYEQYDGYEGYYGDDGVWYNSDGTTGWYNDEGVLMDYGVWDGEGEGSADGGGGDEEDYAAAAAAMGQHQWAEATAAGAEVEDGVGGDMVYADGADADGVFGGEGGGAEAHIDAGAASSHSGDVPMTPAEAEALASFDAGEGLPMCCEACEANKSHAAHFAAYFGHLACLEILLERSASFSEVADSKGRTALFYAAARNHPDCVALLVDVRSGWLDAGDASGDTALHVSACRGHDDTVQLLLESGASAVLANKMGLTATHVAKTNRCLTLLWEYGGDLMAVDSKGRTPLFTMCATGRVSSAACLCELDVDMESLWLPDMRGDSPLHAAACNGHLSCLRLLLEYAAPVTKNEAGLTPVKLAKLNKHKDLVRLLKEYAGDVGTPIETPSPDKPRQTYASSQVRGAVGVAADGSVDGSVATMTPPVAGGDGDGSGGDGGGSGGGAQVAGRTAVGGSHSESPRSGAHRDREDSDAGEGAAAGVRSGEKERRSRRDRSKQHRKKRSSSETRHGADEAGDRPRSAPAGDHGGGDGDGGGGGGGGGGVVSPDRPSSASALRSPADGAGAGVGAAVERPRSADAATDREARAAGIDGSTGGDGDVVRVSAASTSRSGAMPDASPSVAASSVTMSERSAAGTAGAEDGPATARAAAKAGAAGATGDGGSPSPTRKLSAREAFAAVYSEDTAGGDGVVDGSGVDAGGGATGSNDDGGDGSSGSGTADDGGSGTAADGDEASGAGDARGSAAPRSPAADAVTNLVHKAEEAVEADSQVRQVVDAAATAGSATDGKGHAADGGAALALAQRETVTLADLGVDDGFGAPAGPVGAGLSGGGVAASGGGGQRRKWPGGDRDRRHDRDKDRDREKGRDGDKHRSSRRHRRKEKRRHKDRERDKEKGEDRDRGGGHKDRGGGSDDDAGDLDRDKARGTRNKSRGTRREARRSAAREEDWVEFVDKVSGRARFHNARTGETRDEPPVGVAVAAAPRADGASPAKGGTSRSGGKKRLKRKSSGRAGSTAAGKGKALFSAGTASAGPVKAYHDRGDAVAERMRVGNDHAREALAGSPFRAARRMSLRRKAGETALGGDANGGALRDDDVGEQAVSAGGGSRAKKSGVSGAGAGGAAAGSGATAAPSPTATAAQGDWIEHVDKKTGVPFWHNRRTRESTWYKPSAWVDGGGAL